MKRNVAPLNPQALLLEGGGEFKGAMAAADRAALQLAGGRPVVIVPAAAVPEGGQAQAGANGVSWFEGLGVAEARTTGWVDGRSGRDAGIARMVAAAGLIFLPGGSPRYLADALRAGLVRQAITEAQRRGAVIGGSSAGAMVLCEVYFDPAAKQVLPGLNLVPGSCILPHHDTYGRAWAPRVARMAAGKVLVGIDEETGMLNDAPDGRWTVYGRGAVTVYGAGREDVYRSGERFELPGL